jgi:hypothetical protein
VVFVFSITGAGNAAVVIDEDFDDIAAWDDLSEAVSWGGHVGPTSAFEVVGGAVQLKRGGLESTVGFTGYTSADSLKTFTALDQRFPAALTHATDVVTVDLRVRWDELSNSGESGRLVVTLTHDYPSGGLDLDLDDRYDDFGDEWWARPAYQVRLRSAGTGSSQGTALLMYGGGTSDLGEWEANASWWLPGFSSAAGGAQPGVGDDFPTSGWTSTPTGLATTSFRSYRWVIRADQQEIWFDADDDGFDPGDLQAVMPLPPTSPAPLYRYFETFEGIRVYWRGAGTPDASGDPGQVYIDSLTVSVESASAVPVSSPLAVTVMGAAMILATALAARRGGSSLAV